MLSKIARDEIAGFSSPFKITLCIAGFLYVALWCMTIQVNAFQQTQHISPLLPVVAEDSQEYYNLVESMTHGQGFAMNGELETLRTPGYPVFVALVKTLGGSYFAVTFVQILIVFLAALFVRRIGLLFASRRVGEIAAVLLLLNPVTVTLTLLIYSDILFLLLFACGVYVSLTLHQRRFLPAVLAVSLCFGLAIYVRPIGFLALPIFIAPLLACGLSLRKKLQAIAIVLVCLALLIAPWMARNYVRTGVFGYTSIGASAIGWAVARYMANEDALPLTDAYRILDEKIGAPESGWRDIRLSAQVNTVAEGIILAHPLSYLAYHVTTALPFLFPSSFAFAMDIYHDAIGQSAPFTPGIVHFLAAGDTRSFIQGLLQVWWKLLERLVWLGVCAVALFALWLRRREAAAWAFAFIIGYLMLLAGPAAGSRYSLQAWPYLFILFAAGGVYLSDTWRYRRASK